LFRIDAKHRNLKQNEKETKRKRNKKEAKLPSFLLRSEMKRNGSIIIFASMRKKCIKMKKRKRSENFKAKKDKVKFWDNL
jgi:hypothetical protein